MNYGVIRLSIEQPNAPQVVVTEEQTAEDLRSHLTEQLRERPSMYELGGEFRLELSAYWPVVEAAIDGFLRGKQPIKKKINQMIEWEF